MEVYPQEGPMVWRILGTLDWTDKELLEKGARQITYFLTSTPTMVVEVEAVLNDSLLTHTSSEVDCNILVVVANLIKLSSH